MTRKEAIDRFMAGEPLRIGEYRGGEAQPIKWMDRESGKRLESVVVRHYVEFGGKAVLLQGERTPEGYKVSDFKPLFKKGTAIVVHVESMLVQKGNVSISGQLDVLSD